MTRGQAEDGDMSTPQQQRAKAGEQGWVIVETHPQSETKASSEIRRKGYRSYMPKVSRVRIDHRTGEKSIKRQPAMRGYVLTLFPDGVYDDLHDCWGVRRVLKMPGTNEPYRIRRQVVAAIMRAERNMKHEAEEARVYRMGKRFGTARSINHAITQTMFRNCAAGMIVSGAFINQIVTLAGIADSGNVLARVLLMGRETVKEFEPMSEIIPVDDAKAAA